ncbi:Galactoside O-acetyltransferase [compost metagenome]
MFAPNVTISATGHPVDPELRKTMVQFSIPVRIEDGVWIGAGSVVTKDVPANVVAVGNPCRVLREVSERDKEYYYKDLKVE